MSYQFTSEQLTTYETARDLVVRNGKFQDIPEKQLDYPWQDFYKTSIRTSGVTSLENARLSFKAPNNALDETPTTFTLTTRQLDVTLATDCLSMPNNDLMAASLRGTLRQVAFDAENNMGAGSIVDAKVGLIPGATAKSVTQATITTFGYIAADIAELIADIPAAYKDLGADAILYCSNGVYNQMKKNTNTTSNQNEYSLINQNYIADGHIPGYGISKIIPTDALLGTATPATTNQLMCLVIPSADIVENVYSFPLGINGNPIQVPNGVTVSIAWKGALVVKDNNGVRKSQALTVNAGV